MIYLKICLYFVYMCINKLKNRKDIKFGMWVKFIFYISKLGYLVNNLLFFIKFLSI